MLKKLQKTLVFLLAANILIPSVAAAKISINEIAWMGNDKSQYGEWVELYNDSADSFDLKNAALYEAGGKTLIIKLTKSIAPGGYYLIARSTPSMPDPVSGLADDLGSFGGSGLSNSGEYLVLKSAAGDILDSVDGTAGWPAGDSATKQTMQFTPAGVRWITATATPRAINANASAVDNNSTTTSTSTDTNGTDSSLDLQFTDLSAHSNPADLSSKAEEVKIFATAGRNRLALANAPISFEEKLFNSKSEEIDGGNVSWSFGDGESATGKLIVHTYKFPGDYAVVMNVVKNADIYVARTNVRVVPPELSITDVSLDYVKIRNQSGYEANIGGWQIASSRSHFTFPQDTIILPKKEISFSANLIGFDPGAEQVELLCPARSVVSIFRPKKEQVVFASTTSATTSAALLAGLEERLLEARKFLAAQNTLAEIKPADPVHEKRVIKADQDPSVAAVAVASTSLKSKQIVIEKPKSFFGYLRSLIRI